MKINKFTIFITCDVCKSDDVEVDLLMNQGTGLLAIECNECGYNPDLAYDTDDLQKAINIK